LIEAGGTRRRGRGQRLLYWFRTPPGVRVGRTPIDEEAMRLLEQNNPDVQFDWARLLKEAAPDPAPRRDRERDERDLRIRERRERRDQRGTPRSQQERPPQTSAAAAPPMMPPSPESAAEQAIADRRAAEHAEYAERQRTAAEHAEYAERGRTAAAYTAAEHAEYADRERTAAEYTEYADTEGTAAQHAEYAGTAADVAGTSESAAATTEPSTPASERLGVGGVQRLRSRYQDILTRLAQKEDLEEPVRIELKRSAERLNPDAWRTPEEVAAALEGYEAVFEYLRSVVGRHSRRAK